MSMKPQRTMLTDDGELRDVTDEPQEKAPETIYCTQCGSNNPLGSHFCRNCGSSLDNQDGTYPKPKRTMSQEERPHRSGNFFEVFKLAIVAIIVLESMKASFPTNFIVPVVVLALWAMTELARYGVFK